MTSVLDTLSPAELVADVLNRLGRPDIAPHGCIVGPANNVQQQEGVIQMVAAGLPVVDLYTPTQWMRCQMRCLAGTLDDAEKISQRIKADFHERQRTIGRMASTNRRYLIHIMNITAGPSMHFDSSETWETLVFAEIMIGTDPIS